MRSCSLRLEVRSWDGQLSVAMLAGDRATAVLDLFFHPNFADAVPTLLSGGCVS